jgi:ubiquinone/menaquinone biosynthesis C-methylase UbiE
MGIYSRHIFPWLMNRAMSGDNFTNIRRSLLADVQGMTLEIGFGTGLNLPHYPSSIERITTVDVNPGMGPLAGKQAEQSPIQVDWRVLDSESLPMDDETFDSVVSTWTLCSIPNVQGAIGEIYRVLKPDGRFFFVEHGLSNEPDVQKWQRRLNPVQKIIGDGCHLTRDIAALIRLGGFRFVELERMYMDKVPRIGGYLYRGIAARSPATGGSVAKEPSNS